MNKQIEIIAEIAQGYEGSFDLAYNFAKSVSNINASAIKFQMIYADEISVPRYSHYKFFKTLEISANKWKKIVDLLKKNKKKIYFDIFGNKSLSICEKIKVDGIKIHPTDILNFKFLKKVAKSKIKKIFLGVAGISIQDVKDLLEIFKNKKIILMVGYQGYPTKIYENRIKNIRVLKNLSENYSYDISFGFADHEPTTLENTKLLSSMAIGSGASYIEKHLTLSHSLKLEDNESAINPDQFDNYSRSLKYIYDAYKLGDEKILSYSKKESNYLKKVSRSVVTSRNIKKNQIIKINDLTLKRSSVSDSFTLLKDCIGKKAKINFKTNEVLTKKNIS